MSVKINLDFSVLDDFIESLQKADGVVYYTAPYAIYVEMPTEGGYRVPISELKPWVKRNINTDNVEQTAYAIQEKIYQRGTSGVYFLSRAKSSVKNNNIDNYADSNMNISDAPEEIVENIIQDLLSKSNNNIKDDAIDTGAMLESGTYEMDVNIDKSEPNVDITEV